MNILVLIDLQNDFISGPLGTKEAAALINNIPTLYNQVQPDLTILTQDTHEENYLDTQEGKLLPTKHCIYNTSGWQLSSVVQPLLFEHNVITTYKNTFGCYELPQIIKRYIPELKNATIHLAGLCTDICVINNAMILKSAFPEIPIIIHSTYCAGTSPEAHENALKAMKQCQIIIQ